MFVVYPVLVMIDKRRGMIGDCIFRDLSGVVATAGSGSVSAQGRWRRHHQCAENPRQDGYKLERLLREKLNNLTADDVVTFSMLTVRRVSSRSIGVVLAMTDG